MTDEEILNACRNCCGVGRVVDEGLYGAVVVQCQVCKGSGKKLQAPSGENGDAIENIYHRRH